VKRTTAVIVGAGQAGLAMSWWLARRGVEHVVLERGDVANTWRTERWDSLTLLTPNWQSRLPGFGYEGAHPDGFRSRDETIAFLDSYARLVAPPLHRNCPVFAVRPSGEGYVVESGEGAWHCRAVVIATGAFNLARVPDLAHSLPSDILQIAPTQYRSPAELPDGGVLVVGAAATGAQLADEIQRSGRDVTVAVGEHVRAPRTYRGRDIQWWMDATGLNDERFDQVENLNRVRNLASFQLAGYPDRRDIDLNALRAIGVRLVGRVAGVRDGKLQLSGSLRNKCELADLKANRLLKMFDEWATERALDGELPPSYRLAPTQIDAVPPLSLDLAKSGIRTVLWATGFRPDYQWLHVPVLDRKGNLVHQGGVVTDAPGLYALGLPFLRRRKSTLIDGVGDDARDLSAHLAAHVGAQRTKPAVPHMQLDASPAE
jgi:putative flavoprotein involved in K+ transport